MDGVADRGVDLNLSIVGCGICIGKADTDEGWRWALSIGPFSSFVKVNASRSTTYARHFRRPISRRSAA